MAFTLREGAEGEDSGRKYRIGSGDDLAVHVLLERSRSWTEACVQREREEGLGC